MTMQIGGADSFVFVIAHHVAEKLGISGDAAGAYAREVIAADFEQPGDNDVVHKVMRDLSAKGVALTEQ